MTCVAHVPNNNTTRYRKSQTALSDVCRCVVCVLWGGEDYEQSETIINIFTNTHALLNIPTRTDIVHLLVVHEKHASNAVVRCVGQGDILSSRRVLRNRRATSVSLLLERKVDEGVLKQATSMKQTHRRRTKMFSFDCRFAKHCMISTFKNSWKSAECFFFK